MDTLLQDVRYALRVILRNPGFATVAVLALALGIGANTAIFSAVNAVVLKPLPYDHPDKLLQLWMRFTGIGIPNDRNWVSPPEFMDLENNSSFSGVAAIAPRSYSVDYGSGPPEQADAAVVSPSFFPVLGVQARVGRTFLEEEGQLGRNREVILSEGLWRRRFGADPGIAGRKLTLNGQSYTIVGVAPDWVQLPRDAELWTPLAFTPDDLSENSRGSHGYQVIARMRPGLGLEQIRSDMAAVSNRIVEQHPDYNYRGYHFTVLVVPLLEQEIGDIKLALWVLMGAVGLVLLIACANVANLLLVRASAREREIAVRQALGVGRGRLIRQLLTESSVLGLAGGAAGLLLAEWALRTLTALGAASFPRLAGARIDLPVLLFTLGVSLATGILFGLAPAFQAARHDPHEALKEGSRGSGGRRSQGLRGVLVVAEIALSLTLMAGSGLLIRSFLELQQVDGGFRPEGVLTMRVALPVERYPKPQQMNAFFHDLVDRVRHLPGVDAAGAVNGLPLSGTGFSGTVTVDTTAVPLRATTPEADQRPATDGYFETLGIALVRGRYFDERDREDSAPVAIVDETMAKTYWPNQDPVGRRIRQGGTGSTQPWRTIVGVVKHVRYRTLESPSRVEIYWPYAQTSFALGGMSLAVRASGDPHALLSAVEARVHAIDPSQPVAHVRTMPEMVAESMARRRLSMFLLAIFAGAALVLAAVGIYGVVSYSVAQRSHEFGIRMALGAGTLDVLRLAAGRGAGLIMLGLGIGVAGALAATRLLSSLLFQVKPSDPVTLGAVAAVLGVVALAASLIPAYRAAAIDPVDALRQQ